MYNLLFHGPGVGGVGGGWWTDAVSHFRKGEAGTSSPIGWLSGRAGRSAGDSDGEDSPCLEGGP